VKKSNFEEVSF